MPLDFISTLALLILKGDRILNGIVDRPDDGFSFLYNSIALLLSRYGTDDALGIGDFSISPDNYNSRDFFILVNNISVILPEWIPAIQDILRHLKKDWIVNVRLGIPPQNNQRPEIDTPGLCISSNNCRELWDTEMLQRVFGNDFKFSSDKGPSLSLQEHDPS